MEEKEKQIKQPELSEEEKQKRRKEKERKQFLIRLFVYAMIFGFAMVCLRFRVVHNNNMFPTLRDGELIVASPFKQPVFDTLVIYTADGLEHIGRIKGQPGDKVEINEQGVIINGSVLMESLPYETKAGDLEYPLEISDDAVFILTDYRDILEDSRTYGEIKKEDIKATVLFRVGYRSL